MLLIDGKRTEYNSIIHSMNVWSAASRPEKTNRPFIHFAEVWFGG